MATVNWNQRRGTYGLAACSKSVYEARRDPDTDTLIIHMQNNSGYALYFAFVTGVLALVFVGTFAVMRFRMNSYVTGLLIPSLFIIFVVVMARNVAPAERWVFHRDGTAQLRTKYLLTESTEDINGVHQSFLTGSDLEVENYSSSSYLGGTIPALGIAVVHSCGVKKSLTIVSCADGRPADLVHTLNNYLASSSSLMESGRAATAAGRDAAVTVTSQPDRVPTQALPTTATVMPSTHRDQRRRAVPLSPSAFRGGAGAHSFKSPSILSPAREHLDKAGALGLLMADAAVKIQAKLEEHLRSSSPLTMTPPLGTPTIGTPNQGTPNRRRQCQELNLPGLNSPTTVPPV